MSVKNDLTPFQISHLKDLRTELNNRVEGGERDLIIKFFNGRPKIVKSSDKKVPAETKNSTSSNKKKTEKSKIVKTQNKTDNKTQDTTDNKAQDKTKDKIQNKAQDKIIVKKN